MLRLHFDPLAHRYWLGERELPSVTTLLAPLNHYDHIPPAILANAAERGRAIHAATEQLDRGHRLDWGRLRDDAIPYLLAWQAFCRDHQPHWLAIEQALHHPELGVAGTLDRAVILGGRRGVLDLKCTDRLPASVGPQTAAYQALWNHGRRKSERLRQRWSVLLRPNGRYRLTCHQDPSDYPTFLACLTLYRWQQTHHATPRPRKGSRL